LSCFDFLFFKEDTSHGRTDRGKHSGVPVHDTVLDAC